MTASSAAKCESPLKACPFCGAHGLFAFRTAWSRNREITQHRAVCYAGCAESPEFRSKREAARWWNRRYTPKSLPTPPPGDQKR